MMPIRAALVLLVAVACAACGSGNLITGPSAEPPQRSVAGSVQDASFRPIAGALVAIVGTGLSTLTGADGSFELTGGISSPVTLRVAKEGYVTETRAADWPTCTTPPGYSFPICPRMVMLVTLESRGQAVDISGDYTVTLAADSACADLPSEARSRTFAASIVPNSPARTRYFVTLQAPSLRLGVGAFEAGVTGDFLALRFTTDPGVVDEIAPNIYILAGGGASTTVVPGASLIAATFDGYLEYCRLKDSTDAVNGCGPGSSALAEPTPSQPVNFASCQSRNHRLTFTRR